MDYREWLTELRSFLDALHRLPGEVRVEVDIAPPLSNTEARDIASRWPTGLPESLRRFWTEGSARVEYAYDWKPPKPVLERLERIMYVGDMFQQSGYFWSAAEVYPDNAGLSEDPPAFEHWARSAALIQIRDGDCLGLDPGADPVNPTVVLLDHEEGECERIAGSFDEFLTMWATLCFIEPSRWNLEAWLDGERGTLDLSQESTAELRKLLTPGPRS